MEAPIISRKRGLGDTVDGLPVVGDFQRRLFCCCIVDVPENNCVDVDGRILLVSACSALNAVVWMRSSMTATTLSMIGKIKKRPGPLTPWSLPARRTTNFCQVLAILSESAMMTAATRKGGAKKRSTVLPRAGAPARAQAITRNRVIGFMLVAPLARSSRASW